MKNINQSILFICITLLCSCNSSQDSTPLASETNTKMEMIKPGFVHAVYFWVKEDADPVLKKDFYENGLPKLATVKSIQSVYYGPPAATEERDVVDNTYSMAWITNFASIKEHDEYQVDPIHLEFVEKYKELWSKVRVYDNEVK